jgi:uncharacterized repeat protein (TIGR03837 family)
MLWDVFCRVVDNHGDIGFAWRLAADLARRGESVRLRVDDARALAWMAPERIDGVGVGAWDAPPEETGKPADVVLETFGCGLPDACAARLARGADAPVWIDVEHLTAESYAARSHGLPSPHASGPATGLTTWFFYPGFDEATGGLLREADLDERRRQFDRPAWLGRLGLDGADNPDAPTPRIVSLFCYQNPRLSELLDGLGSAPTLLLATAGEAALQVEMALGPALARGALRAVVVPRLAQVDYDHLLWASDFNFVRGEDSFVRAQWAGLPFVWQIYPQSDDAHVAKLEAFLDRFLAAATADVGLEVRRAFRAWNGIGDMAGAAYGHALGPPSEGWRRHCEHWRDRLVAQVDLTTRLIRFTRSKMLK